MGSIKIDRNFAPEFLRGRFLLYCAVCLLVLKIFTIAAFVNFPPNIFFADITKTALVDLVNQARQNSGLQILAENEKLDQAARLKAQDMVQNQYFSHTSPDGISPWHWFSEIGYKYKYAGENLAIGFFDSKEVYDAWLNSPSHKANLLNPNYREIGTAVLSGFGQNNAVVVVQLFALSQSNTQVAVNNTEESREAETVPVPEEAPASDTGEKVLSQATESPVSSERFFNFSVYSLGEILQPVIYGFLLIIIGLLLMAIFFSMPVKRQLILRSALIVVLLSFAALINREAVVMIIPHQIII